LEREIFFAQHRPTVDLEFQSEREYDYVPGYYAVFLTDPDGLKL
jgi:hypothetical protein